MLGVSTKRLRGGLADARAPASTEPVAAESATEEAAVGISG
jgi:hypothetical protein